jgi:hypothetical protein
MEPAARPEPLQLSQVLSVRIADSAIGYVRIAAVRGSAREAAMDRIVEEADFLSQATIRLKGYASGATAELKAPATVQVAVHMSYAAKPVCNDGSANVNTCLLASDQVAGWIGPNSDAYKVAYLQPALVNFTCTKLIRMTTNGCAGTTDLRQSAEVTEAMVNSQTSTRLFDGPKGQDFLNLVDGKALTSICAASCRGARKMTDEQFNALPELQKEMFETLAYELNTRGMTTLRNTDVTLASPVQYNIMFLDFKMKAADVTRFRAQITDNFWAAATTVLRTRLALHLDGGSVTLSKVQPPQGLIYGHAIGVHVKDVPLKYLDVADDGTTPGHVPTVVSGHRPFTYTISPALPVGIYIEGYTQLPQLNVDTLSGVISGTPDRLSLAQNYTVTVSNAGGSTTTFVSMTVKSLVCIKCKDDADTSDDVLYTYQKSVNDHGGTTNVLANPLFWNTKAYADGTGQPGLRAMVTGKFNITGRGLTDDMRIVFLPLSRRCTATSLNPPYVDGLTCPPAIATIRGIKTGQWAAWHNTQVDRAGQFRVCTSFKANEAGIRNTWEEVGRIDVSGPFPGQQFVAEAPGVQFDMTIEGIGLETDKFDIAISPILTGCTKQRPPRTDDVIGLDDVVGVDVSPTGQQGTKLRWTIRPKSAAMYAICYNLAQHSAETDDWSNQFGTLQVAGAPGGFSLLFFYLWL